MLKELEDIASEELPCGLAPIHYIYHTMDLVPGTAYQIYSTSDSIGVEWHVEELISKGLATIALVFFKLYRL